ncbi:MAG: hypothetical protein LBG46_01320 [Elusimicrobiota bacterium]|jgi:hypothetical protein|nr:hypothetical protein [Elusimicrobiota bacterium]
MATIIYLLKSIDSIIYASSIGMGIIFCFTGKGAFKTILFIHLFSYSTLILLSWFLCRHYFNAPFEIITLTGMGTSFVLIWLVAVSIVNAFYLHVTDTPFPWSFDATISLISLALTAEQILIAFFARI